MTATPPEVGVEITIRSIDTRVDVQSIPTIEPMPTVAPEPAPITYTISTGDTVFGIAQERQISLDEIYTLNPSLTPELLTVGQVILLPAAEPDPVGTDEALDSASVSAEIAGLAFYRTPLDDLWVLGEVHNTSSHSIGNIRVRIALHDQTGEVLSSDEVDVFPRAILAGQRAPFGYLFEQITDGDISIEAEVISSSDGIDPATRSQDLAIDISKDTIENQTVEITGSIINTGTNSLEDILLVVIFYDKNLSVSGYHFTSLNEDLAPNGSGEFSFVAVTAGPVDASYLTAFGREKHD